MSLAKRDEMIAVLDELSGRRLRGKGRAVRLCLMALLTGGHILLEDLPGLGKTTMALAFAGSMGLSFGRVQCTSDLLPSDITGLSIYDRNAGRFTFIKGPVFNNIVLIDEINRAMPKTQSALLEAMEERRVTVEGVTYPLPQPFLVLATQNPIEQVGTFPLPEAQMDRFILKTGIGYPPEETEKNILMHGSIREEIQHLTPTVTHDDLIEAMRAVHGIYVGEKVIDYVYAIARATREHPMVLAGISTRGAIGLVDAAKAAAYLDGRSFVIPEDVKDVAAVVCSHRLMLKPEQEAIRKEELLNAIVKEIPLPVT
ncbi:AAA family ATPase [Geomesophilobacter sediminis]|uniref:MoxR family ATPase n=1 Tax=Geomesophilobacter sediminis TaxID=2798584 RepID=A0A8J7S9F7_9BACT|nr:MoxR family ATPase [Geomesophilobacter sediminis]MBJ6726760.1 MoxR family ATPase [Geomesophilobacter sediminis]